MDSRQYSARPFCVLAIIAVALLMCEFVSNAQLVRIPNSTLQMSQTPAKRTGYALEPTFGVAFGQGLPVAMATPPGETNRLFVVEKSGRITVLTNLSEPVATTRPFLNLDPTGSVLRKTGEAGALGLAFHPNFSENGYFYVFYTPINPSSGSNFFDRLSRFQLSATNRNVADPSSELVLLNQPDLYDTHNGGDLHFGPDGYLYVSLGDGGGGDIGAATNAQQIAKDFFSGILRIDVDKRPGNLPPAPHLASSTNYCVPADNPFVGATNFNGIAVDPTKVRSEFWAVGLRNPWRICFDAPTSTLWCADVGDTSIEEVNIIEKGGNYGWSFFEGSLSKRTPPAGFKFVLPIYEYPRFDGGCVIGGRVYRGSRIPQLQGAYVFADFVSGNVWALRVDANGKAQTERLLQYSGISSFGVDPSNGDLLATSLQDGTIRRLVYREASVDALPRRNGGFFYRLVQLNQ